MHATSNHIMFSWDNAYDGYSAEAIGEVMRPDIIESCEEDGYHFRSTGDLQSLSNVFAEYQMTFKVLELLPGVTLSAVICK